MLQFYSNYYENSRLFHGSLFKIMGTRFEIVISGCNKNNAESVWYKIIGELERLEKMLNRYDAESEIAAINAYALTMPVPVSNEIWDILKDCKKYYELTGGLFDITLNDYSLVVLDDAQHLVSFESANLLLDLGGYGKGFALEKIKTILLNTGVENALIDFGNSSIVGLGHHPQGDCWSVSIKNPFDGNEIAERIDLRNTAMSTSGNKPLHKGHIINPFTKEFNEEQKLVSVSTDNAVDAEVLTTSLMIANEVQMEEIIKRFKIDKLIVFNN